MPNEFERSYRELEDNEAIDEGYKTNEMNDRQDRTYIRCHIFDEIIEHYIL